MPPISCPKCGEPIKYIPAGVSKKTGKRYSEFWACSNRSCDYSWRPQPEIKKATQDNLIRGLGLLRGEHKKLDEKLEKILKLLEEGTVYYPPDSANKTWTEPSEEPPEPD